MKIKEKFPLNDNSLFVLMNNHRPFAWNEFYTPLQMDNYFYFTQGEARVNFNFEDVEIETIANMLSEMFVDKWNKIYNRIYAEDVNLCGYTETIHEELEGDTTVTETETNSDLEKYTAYDSASLEDKTSETENNSRHNTGNNTRTLTRTKTGNNSNYINNVNSLLSMFTYRFLYDIVIRDIKKILVNPIY